MAENFGAFVRRIRETGVVKLPVLTIDCSANPNYPAGAAGDVYRVTGAGKIGGGSGIDVQVKDELLCLTDSVAGTHAAVGANWLIIQGNVTSTADVPDSTNARYMSDVQEAAVDALGTASTHAEGDFETAGAAAAAQAAAIVSAATDATTKAAAAQAAAEATAATDATTKANAAQAAAEATAASDATTKANARMATDGSNADLPTSNPGAGKLWNDSGTVKVGT
jgi:hypothetical protein